ncbi:MAG TPA: SDR family oxidoreductase [Acidobacteriaceae bacterium]|jgi:nucleoside-diphosphate-sugar epimerase|nr:SDR family oxidoreductase [Acidobacteriaceae bacterium]
MHILIAGGAGYVGSALIPKLLDRGYKVDVVDLFWFGNNLPEEVGVLEKDIFDLQVSDLSGFDQVIFLAGLSNDPMADFSPAKNFVFNASAPAYLAYIAKKAKVRRYIYASSCSVYGYTENQLFDEDSPVSSSYPYGISKLQGEKAVTQMVSPEFSVIALRKGTVSGYSPRMRFDLLVNTMFKCAMQEGVIHVTDPAIWRPFLAIEDATMAYTRAIEANDSLSGIFNIASGNHTVGEVADLVKLTVEEELGKKIALDIKHIKDMRNYKVSIERAETILSFHPHQSVRSIVRSLISNMDKYADLDNPLYYNIRVFRELDKQNQGAGQAPLAATGSRP